MLNDSDHVSTRRGIDGIAAERERIDRKRGVPPKLGAIRRIGALALALLVGLSPYLQS